ncbi:MAG TPA: zinc ribbon domain-containing protein [Terriglobales bacterium]|nr:zinc ribbon domain-containing protein [Terriglobales bacterium]
MPCRALLSGWLYASFKDVEHACQQCGTAVEDGRPFCPQCRAPQIHVQMAVPDAEITASFNPAPDELTPETPQSGHFDRPSVTAVMMTAGSTMDSRIAVRAALKAGMLGVFIGAIPFIGIALVGALAVFFYRRKSRLTLPPALGARLGGAAGVVVFAIGALLAIAVVALHAQQQCIDMMMAMYQRLGVSASDPRIQASIRSVFTPSGQAIAFFFTVVPASIGGALASLFLRPRNPRD